MAIGCGFARSAVTFRLACRTASMAFAESALPIASRIGTIARGPL
jgi:hypothetical protein